MFASSLKRQDWPCNQKLDAFCRQLFVTGMILWHCRTFLHFVRIKNITEVSIIIQKQNKDWVMWEVNWYGSNWIDIKVGWFFFARFLWKIPQLIVNDVNCLMSYKHISRKIVTFIAAIKVVLIRLGIYVFVNKARGGGSPKFFINTLWHHNYMRVKLVYLWHHSYIIRNTNCKQPR